ncbi:hypothetical protein [Capnocytophaga catalasegens]|uniref:Uncharacterized protein n=1 Tax=Capnocytophaga catalasegens TaxID=1004260 RepID=A0AAV5AYS7_9FLAO|nr:hypothetical protein [Capnocytophaga catalasegens]GIZ14783.1 hypothetical protein RCZ03_07830 [Capnocytophaga catalasegens]GJM51151.1 hypothetical protein RCZ15_21240 [Capnocytophaga catalasegens]GJM53538.1 hypothetical protein RCZ16_18540 [Capnocytophaga catalasegens]
MYKNFDDVMGTLPEKIWNDIRDIFSEKEKLEKNAYQINGLKNEHFKLKISNETIMDNHYIQNQFEFFGDRAKKLNKNI